MRPGDLALSFGTSGTAFAVTRSASADGSGVVAGFADATGRYLPLVCTLNATRVTSAVARLLGLSLDAFNRAALAAPAGSGGVVCVPHFDGERTPRRPESTGRFDGLRADTTPGQLARAAVEGVVANLLGGADAILDGGVSQAPGRIFVVGGGARSAVYRQVVADLTGRAVLAPRGEELVARGAAVQAAAALAGSSVDEVVESWRSPSALSIDPNPTVDRLGILARYAEAAEVTGLTQ